VPRSAAAPEAQVVRGLENGVGAYRAGRAGLVDDHDLLAEFGLQLTRDETDDLVGGTTRAPGDDHLDGLGGLPVLRRRREDAQDEEDEDEQGQSLHRKASLWKSYSRGTVNQREPDVKKFEILRLMCADGR
jgi:hypothetical protein